MAWKKEYTVLTLLLLAGTLLRLATLGVPNFAPITAMALFGAAYFGSRMLAVLLPMAALLLSDVLMQLLYKADLYTMPGFYPGMYWQYIAFGMVALAGIALLRKVTVVRTIVASITGTAIFFLLTNGACWFMDIGDTTPGLFHYPDNLGGLWASLAAGLPFLKATLAGDLAFSALFIGGYAWLHSRTAVLAR